ncbi:MAG: TIGR04165 family Cys-rich peptide [Methanobrevibacter sp.]|nr:TIGR04165 family Cys-rich peptide [Methanobrevibacter sp.]
MKLEEILAPCPKCGSKDKTAKRRMLDSYRAHAELDTVTCDECGYIFIVNDKMEDDEKKKIIKELNKYYG